MRLLKLRGQRGTVMVRKDCFQVLKDSVKQHPQALEVAPTPLEQGTEFAWRPCVGSPEGCLHCGSGFTAISLSLLCSGSSHLIRTVSITKGKSKKTSNTADDVT